MQKKILQIGRLVITNYRTFGVKKLWVVCNCEQLLLVNVYGFGLWYIRNSTPQEIRKLFAK